MRTPATLLGFILLLSAAPAAAQTWSPEQQEIWKFEEEQWKLSMAKDLSWIPNMTHANLSYWDSDQPTPQNQASLTRWSKYNYGNSTVLEQELFPISATITGNIAVVHYRYRLATENYKKERETVTGRYTDVLVKEGGRWRFITWAGGDDPKQQ
jgi:ketosteroid isomerase-like protein